MSFAFQLNKSEGLCATYHFTFKGSEQAKATVVITDKTIQVEHGHIGIPDVQVDADSATWLRVLHKETPIVKQIILRKIRVKGPLKLFTAFS
jgi:putative sterol carrier protein